MCILPPQPESEVLAKDLLIQCNMFLWPDHYTFIEEGWVWFDGERIVKTNDIEERCSAKTDMGRISSPATRAIGYNYFFDIIERQTSIAPTSSEELQDKYPGRLGWMEYRDRGTVGLLDAFGDDGRGYDACWREANPLAHGDQS